MTLDEIIKWVGTPVGIFTTVVGAAFGGFIIKSISDSVNGSKSNPNVKISKRKEIEQTEETEQSEEDDNEYKSTPVKKALVADTLCELNGEITSVYPLGNAYSGLIKDESGEIPFIADPENNGGVYDDGEVGLIPIVLNDALKTKHLISLYGQSNNSETVFNVDMMEYKLNGKKYGIGFEEYEE